MNTITRDSYQLLSNTIFRHQSKFLFVDTVLLLSIIVSTVVILYILKKSNKLLIPSLILLHNIAMSAAICIISAIFVLLVDDLGNVDSYNSTVTTSTVLSACILAAGLLCLVCLFAIVIKSKNKVLLIILSAVVLLCAGNAGVSYVKAKTYAKTIEDATLRMETAAEAYGLPDFGMTNVGEGARVSKSQLEMALAHCESAPQLKDSPRFQYLLGTPTGEVKLSPNDVLMLYLYSGTAETVEYTKDSYSGQAIAIIMHTDDPNSIGYGMATTENQTINENP